MKQYSYVYFYKMASLITKLCPLLIRIGINPETLKNASPKDILHEVRRMRNKLSLKFHPDKNPKGENIMKAVSIFNYYHKK